MSGCTRLQGNSRYPVIGRKKNNTNNKKKTPGGDGLLQRQPVERAFDERVRSATQKGGAASLGAKADASGLIKTGAHLITRGGPRCLAIRRGKRMMERSHERRVKLDE